MALADGFATPYQDAGLFATIQAVFQEMGGAAPIDDSAGSDGATGSQQPPGAQGAHEPTDSTGS